MSPIVVTSAEVIYYKGICSMKNIINKVHVVSTAALLVMGMFATTGINVVRADNEGKMTICHAAGQDGTTKFETLTLSRNAVYQDQGNGGHFYEDGTPKAGHENDYMGACHAEVVAEATSTPTPSADPTATPTPTPAATAAPASNNNESSSNNSSNSGSNTGSTPEQGEVLGAETYAKTGVVEDVIMNTLGSVGGLMTAVGSVLYGKKKNHKTV